MAVFAYIGLGSNLGDRRAMIADALERLKPRRVSTVVETAPWGRADQPAFLNAVAEIETDLEPAALLDRLLDLERGLGRVRHEKWGPRSIDLDLLLYGERRVSTESLSVPHPHLHERRFVLEGLAELCPDRTVPGLDRTVRELLEKLP
ncbi:MAG TPA: 2-amino-4-hydroxy-6-hydroxymethyldihydropteridine diphosphokinase [Planctomycetota bacterium]|jgi:2-amino-4-hydroxy-6-hydroxymethyldihydropteridine diphosphokinase|nr:2-amino-4-hydroxy-6-hydroxymethyldihydropteridine diphosphokinase [Planctomycetota bacterium]